MAEHRYPLSALVAASGLTEAALARKVGLSGTSLKMARRLGLVERAADRCAVRAGLTPWLVWPDWLEDALVECAERSCEARFVPVRKTHRFCSKACCVREQMQKYRSRRADDEEYLEMRRQESRAYYAACGSYVRARQRAYNQRRKAAA